MINHSAMIPPIKTPVRGLYLATMSQIYPWDRGTANALTIGKQAAEMLIEDFAREGLKSPPAGRQMTDAKVISKFK